MKKILLYCLVPFHFFSQTQWTQKANVPDNLGGSVAFSIGNKGYLGLGFNPNYVRNFYVYDTTLNSWGSIPVFPGTANCYSEGFSANGKGYVALGQNTVTLVKQVWEYNPVTNSWLQKSDFPGLARTEAVSFVINNKLYIGTGTAGNPGGLQKDFYEWDPLADIWIQKANFGGGSLMGGVAFSIGNKGYVCLGIDSTFNTTNELWEYDVATDAWKPRANFPSTGRLRAVGFSLNGKGYAGTGTDFTNSNFDFHEYDPQTDTWLSVASLSNIPRQVGTAFTIGNAAYAGTGGNTGIPYYNDFWKFTKSIPTVTSSTNVGELEAFPYQEMCSVFPNPATEIIQLNCTEKVNAAHLTNCLGQEIKLTILNDCIHLNEIDNGVYFLKLTDAKNNFTIKQLIIHR
jgi:N-acetylneuraminic acid mutarotase